MKNKSGKVITFLIILISSLFVFTFIANAQTPTPPTRESLIEEIKLRAQKDVELGATPQSPSDLAVLFSEQASTVGMTMSEVKNIYDEAYKAATPAKSPWDDLLKPQGGWIFLIVGGLLVILGNIAKDYLTAFGKKLAEIAYQRLARFRPFWMIALRRYRQSLENTYRELKIPFRAGRPLEMKDVYVPVRVDGGDKKQVDAYQTIQNQKRLVVLGDPGSGKTMFLRHVAFTYARQGLDDFDGQPVPVYLELNRVEGAGGDLLAALTKMLENHNFPGAEGFLKSALENHALLILLDGLDEVNTVARLALVNQIQDFDQKHPANRIIVTCRKAVYQGELDAWVDGKLEIIEFSDQQIQRFMTSWQKDMPAEKSIEHFFRTLQERPQIMALARNPLLLTMVAYLYVDTEFALPHSRSEFYSRSTDLLLDQWKLERNRYKATHKRIVLQRLALFNQSQAGKTGERRTLELADVLKEIRAVLPDLTLKTEDAQPLLDEILQRSGLMLAIDGGTRYQFPHLTLQEYFAARALEADQKGLLDYYRATPDAWREVVRLWCALEHDSTAMLNELYTLDPVIAFECLSDAQQVDNAYADELIERFKLRFRNEALTHSPLMNAFGLLAADPRPRGKKWFEFVKDKLNDEDCRLISCIVLAQSNIPQAAEPLAKLAKIESSAVSFLVQLGNLAVPALTEFAQRGEVWAMDALVDIGTPQAALALQPMLWINEVPIRTYNSDFELKNVFKNMKNYETIYKESYSDKRPFQSAWRLAALLSLHGVEDILRTVNLTSEQRKTKQVEWIWEPFTDDLTLRAITGRIAYLLHATPETELPSNHLPCDPRLTIPLCTVAESGVSSADIDKKIRDRIEGEVKVALDNTKLRHLSVQQQKAIVDEFSSQLSKKQVWQHIFATLSTNSQFKLLYFWGFGYVIPSADDWRNLFKPISYNFSNSWQSKLLKLLFLLLVAFNFWCIGVQISQSADFFSWENIIAVIISVVLLATLIWIQFRDWDTYNLSDSLYIAILGIGPALGVVIGNLTHNWIFGAVTGVLMEVFWVSMPEATSNYFDNAKESNGISYLFGITLSSAIFGALSGGANIGDSFRISLGISLVVSLVFPIIYAIIYPSKLRSDFIVDLILSPIGFVIASVSGVLDLFLVYFPSKFLFNLSGLSIIIFWLMWLGSFYFIFLSGRRLERRAQNPLHGLLEASGIPSSNKVTNKRMAMVGRLLRWRG